MAKRKPRTRIRTAAGSVQEQFRARIDALIENPLCVLPEGYEQVPSLLKLGKSIEKMGDKPGFFDKRDKGIRGAIAQAFEIAKQEAFPRIADVKMGGRRRFFLHRGHIPQSVNLGVQNHDEPRVLRVAYQPMAKEEKFHVFATRDQLYARNDPIAPRAWVDMIATDLGIEFEEQGTRFVEAGPGDKILLGWNEGTQLAWNPKKGRNTHGLLQGSYVGPGIRLPFEVAALRGNQVVELDREAVAKFRGGLLDEVQLLRTLDA